jgi:hypothetical protein
LSNDVDLFVHDKAGHRALVAMLPSIAEEVGCTLSLRQDAGSHVRGELKLPERFMEFDLVYEPVLGIRQSASCHRSRCGEASRAALEMSQALTRRCFGFFAALVASAV